MDAANEEKSPLLSSWELQSIVGQPPAKIRVRNLQTSLKVARDAWGRFEKEQPVLISVSVSLRHAFESASAQDEVTNSTVHYGSLSKAVLETCRLFSGLPSKSPPISFRMDEKKTRPLCFLVDSVHFFLTSFSAVENVSQSHILPLLKPEMMTSLEIRVLLPKASLLGSGVSFTQSTCYERDGERARHRSLVLVLHDLSIHTIIGVNLNERLAKQVVIANIEIEPWTKRADVYNELEQIVFKTIEESSFRTLETLAKHLGERIISCFIVPQTHLDAQDSDDMWDFPNVKISLEKPTAVTFADAPCVELLVPSHPQRNEGAKGLWLRAAGGQCEAPPFPLQGSLREWVEGNR